MLTSDQIGQKICSIRDDQDMTQSDMVERLSARGVKMSRETLSKIENGNRAISAVELIAIANVLLVDPNEFFEEESEQDLVVLFRQVRPETNIVDEEIREVQDMMESFLRQAKIHKNGPPKRTKEPIWKG